MSNHKNLLLVFFFLKNAKSLEHTGLDDLKQCLLVKKSDVFYLLKRFQAKEIGDFRKCKAAGFPMDELVDETVLLKNQRWKFWSSKTEQSCGLSCRRDELKIAGKVKWKNQRVFRINSF